MGGKSVLRAALIAGLLTVLYSVPAAFGQAAPPGVGEIAEPAVVPSEDTLETTYGLAMGAGVRAGAIGPSALAYNTSNMAAVSTYQIEIFSQVIPGSKSDGGTYWNIGSSVTDSTTSKKIAMGTSFRYVFDGENREYKGWDWRSGIGVQVIPQLGIGIGFRWASMKSLTTASGQRRGPTFDGVTLGAPEHVAKARLAFTLRPAVHAVAEGAGAARRRGDGPDRVGGVGVQDLGEQAKTAAAERLGHVLHLDRVAQVRLVGAVPFGAVGVADPGPELVDLVTAAEFLEDAFDDRLNRIENIVLGDEAHLDVQLIEIGR